MDNDNSVPWLVTNVHVRSQSDSDERVITYVSRVYVDARTNTPDVGTHADAIRKGSLSLVARAAREPYVRLRIHYVSKK